MEQKGLAAVRKILESSPKIGVYAGETYEDWRNFFKFFITFLKSELGPRGDVTKKTRAFFEANKQQANKHLQTLQLDTTSTIRDVYIRFTNFSPSETYTTYLLELQKLEKLQANETLIRDSESLMYKSIKKGLMSKHGEEYDFEGRMCQIQKQYAQKLELKLQRKAELFSILDHDIKYHQYIKTKEYLRPLVEQWEKVDKQTGNSSVNRGKLFEERCCSEGLTQVYEKLGRSDYIVYQNCKWEQREIGEIDIALASKTVPPVIQVLIECKSRLFDIVQAYYQVGPERLKYNKHQLYTKNGVIPVKKDAEFFIMTTLPEHDFVLPFESRLKAELERATKAFTVDAIQEKELYETIYSKMGGDISPLDWFNKYSDQYLIVLDGTKPINQPLP